MFRTGPNGSFLILLKIMFVTAMTKKVTGAKIALLDFSLQKAKMKLGVQVLVEDPAKLDAIRQR